MMHGHTYIKFMTWTVNMAPVLFQIKDSVSILVKIILVLQMQFPYKILHQLRNILTSYSAL